MYLNNKMNILSIGIDYTLAMPTSEVMGEAQRRQIMYAKYVKSLHIIVQCLRRPNLQTHKIAQNLFIYPTNSSSRIKAVYDSYRIANRICKNHQIDLITTQDPFTCGIVGYLLKRKHRLPLNIQMHSDNFDNRYWLQERKYNYLFNFVGKKLIHKADTLRVGTSREKEKLIQRWGIKPDKIYLLPVVVDINKFINPVDKNIRGQFISQGFEKIVLFVGRLVYPKDLTTLFKAAKIVIDNQPKTLFMFVGDGKERNSLEAFSKRLGISSNVIFTGEIARDDVPKYFHSCDVFALSSVYEGTCLVLVEAAASGKPIVTTNIAGADDIVINDKTGSVVEPKDFGQLAEKIIYLLEHPEVAEKMGRAGFKHITEVFDEEKMVSGLIKMWEETVKNYETT
jgi:glycosyltransferase involved in cell wall biosynthesis